MLNGKLFLVVDDDKDIVYYIGVTLRKYGANVIAANTVKEALNQLHYFTFDGIIVDINLPDGSGYDILKEIKDNQIPSPVIATSGLLDVYMASVDGFSYRLEKPFMPGDLLDILLIATRISIAN